MYDVTFMLSCFFCFCLLLKASVKIILCVKTKNIAYQRGHVILTASKIIF